MGAVYLGTVNIPAEVRELGEEIVIVNDINVKTNKGFDALRSLLYTIYDSDSIPSMPTCACGKIYGEYKKNSIHDECGSIVKDRENAVAPILAVRSFKSDIPFILPDIYNMLKLTLLKGRSATTGISVLDYIINPLYNWEKNATPAMKRNKNHDIFLNNINSVVLQGNRSKGYKYFIDNFYDVMDRLISFYNSELMPSTVTRLVNILEICSSNRDSVFTRYLLLPNKLWLSMENTATGRYVNQDLTPIQDIAIASAKFTDMAQAEKLTVAILNKMLIYVTDVNTKQLDKKSGLFRKHIYGTRTLFSYRSVITSITDVGDYEVVEAPWAYAIKTFRPYILNYLINNCGHSYTDAVSIISNDVTYHIDVDNAFNHMIKTYQDKGYKGIPITTNRNPSIKNGSISPVYIGGVKSDPNDLTGSMSTGIIKPFNADFDGDQMNNMALCDKYLIDMLEPLSVYYDILSDTTPCTISEIYIPTPIVAILNNYLNDTGDINNEDKGVH